MDRSLQVRQAVRMMNEYHPPLSGRNGLRLDFNENTDAPSQRVAEVLKRIATNELTKYPERDPTERIVAEFLKLSPDQVLLTNGIDEAVHLLCEAYLEPGDEVIIVVPTFSMYEIYAQSTGAKVIAIQADSQQGFCFPTKKVLENVTSRTRLIAVATPNNPTGAVVARADLLQLSDSAPQAAVLVDEAYYDFWGESVLDAVARSPNLFVTRTFSKAYGLAGLRIGVLAGHSAQMSFVRKVSSPYNVNCIALACLPEALADRDSLTGYVRQVIQGRGRLMVQLAFHGVPFWISQANFVLTKIGHLHREFVAEMRKRGILVRDRSKDPGCDGCVRITVGRTEHTERLLLAFPDVLNSIGWSAPARKASARIPMGNAR